MKRIAAIISSAALLSASVFVTPAVMAQSAPASGGSTASSAAAQQNFSDADLKSFATATKGITPIAQDYSQRIQAAGQDKSKATQLSQEANTKMEKVVQSNGLTVDKYNQITQSLQQNPQLLERVKKMVQQ